MEDMAVSQTQGPCELMGQAAMVMGSNFYLDKRYALIEPIGSGAYGTVVSAKDRITGKKVAIKKIEKVFNHPIYAKRTLREMRVIRLLNHENILQLETIQLPETIETFKDLYLISDLMESDLSQIIKSPQPLTDQHVQFFLYQILRGMKYMHSAGILHRDIKPRNIFINSNCDLKLGDFGLARLECTEADAQSAAMTDYIATRWYRPPELLLGKKGYTKAIDVWAVGCILGELLRRRPLFPGKSTAHQCQVIFDLIGTPSFEEICQVNNRKAREFIESLPRQKPLDFESVFRGANPLALDLLEKLLAYRPEDRYTVDQAIEHPYLAKFYCPDDEPVAACRIPTFDFKFENKDYDLEKWKKLIYDEVLLYHFPKLQKAYEKKKLDASYIN